MLAPLRFLARIPGRDWIRHGVPIVVGYAMVYVAVGYSSSLFTANEGRFLGLIEHPLTALFFSVFVTVLLQASFITEFAVVFAAAHLISLPVAIALVLGGNIGTCITNTVVSFLSFRDRAQFGRSFSASIAHDLFNVFMVYVVLPAELTTQFFSRHVLRVAQALGAQPVAPATDPVPASGMIDAGPAAAAVALAVVAAIAGVLLIVYNLRKLFFARMETALRESVFVSRGRSVASGVGFTFLVHSSSLSTSMVVPLVGSGAVPLHRAFYYLLGCNVGTAFVTVALTLPVLLAGDVNGVAVALAHLLFNGYGLLLFLALPFLGSALCAVAERLGDGASRWSRPRLAFALAGAYYVAPGVLFLVCLQVL